MHSQATVSWCGSKRLFGLIKFYIFFAASRKVGGHLYPILPLRPFPEVCLVVVLVCVVLVVSSLYEVVSTWLAVAA